MIQYLIILLSTDWFLPFWSQIGLDIETAVKARMQESCREIVRNVIVKKSVDDEGEFDYIDYSEECKSRAKFMLIELIERLNVKSAASAVVNEWTRWTHDDLSTAMMLRILTHELVEGVGGDVSPAPDSAIRSGVIEAISIYDFDPSEFWEISTKSVSSWDMHVQSLFVETPKALSDHLYPVVQEHRLRLLWGRVSERLTVQQRRDLLSWYRAMAKYRNFPTDPVPHYIC